MTRVPLQGTLPLGRKEKVLHRQWRQRASGHKVRPGPGRPKAKHKTGVSHQSRPELPRRSALHVTLRLSRSVPNLRTRRRYAVIKQAFVRFCEPSELGFRLIHFAVLGNHLHFVVEVDSKHALSRGMQKLCHSISRRLNALSLREHGASQSTKAGRFCDLKGWLGRVFSDRFFAHHLKTPTEMQRALHYVRANAERHFAGNSGDVISANAPIPHAQRRGVDPFSSFAELESGLVAKAKNTLLARLAERESRFA